MDTQTDTCIHDKIRTYLVYIQVYIYKHIYIYLFMYLTIVMS